jgi:hypothetical protein
MFRGFGFSNMAIFIGKMMINHQVWDIPDFQTHPLSQQNRGIQAA